MVDRAAYFFSGAFFSSAFLGSSFLASGFFSAFFLSAFFSFLSFFSAFLGSAFLALSSAFDLSVALSAGAAAFCSALGAAGAAWANHRPVVDTTNIMANRIARTFFICFHHLSFVLFCPYIKEHATRSILHITNKINEMIRSPFF